MNPVARGLAAQRALTAKFTFWPFAPGVKFSALLGEVDSL